MTFFRELEQILQIFIWKLKRPQIATVILRKKNEVGGIALSDIKLLQGYRKENSMVLHENRHIGQWN